MSNGIKQTVNRTFKSSVFVMLFSDAAEALKLYNAVNGTNYKNPEELEINTLDNAIYMGIKNDVSFVIDSRLSLYEHQSTYSPNLPLRFLMYVADLYSSMTRQKDLYSEKVVKLPPPKFLIFYNGEKPRAEREVLRLSDAYQVREGQPSLELEAVVLNINPGNNPVLLKVCKTLGDYAEYVERVRRYAGEMNLPEAVERAITECIQEGILADFLERNRAEVKKVSLYEYDAERHMRQIKEDGIEEGRNALLKELIEKKRKKGLSVEEIAEILEADLETVRTLIEERN